MRHLESNEPNDWFSETHVCSEIKWIFFLIQLVYPALLVISVAATGSQLSLTWRMFNLSLLCTIYQLYMLSRCLLHFIDAQLRLIRSHC